MHRMEHSTTDDTISNKQHRPNKVFTGFISPCLVMEVREEGVEKEEENNACKIPSSIFPTTAVPRVRVIHLQ